LNTVGIEQAIDFNIIGRWNITFRCCETFPHPNPVVALGKNPEPTIF